MIVRKDRMQTIHVGFLKDKVWFAEQSRKHRGLLMPSTEADKTKTKTKFYCSLDPFLFCGKLPHPTEPYLVRTVTASKIYCNDIAIS